jgi:Tetratricopeptide repeat.
MGNFSRLLFLLLGLVLGVVTVALADPAQDFAAAVSAVKAGDVDKAMGDIDRVIAVGSSMDARHLSNAYNFRGMCHEAKKEYPQAMADYSKAIEIFDKSSEALGNRSLLYYKLGDMDKSKADAMAAKRIDRKVKVPEFDK